MMKQSVWRNYVSLRMKSPGCLRSSQYGCWMWWTFFKSYFHEGCLGNVISLIQMGSFLIYVILFFPLTVISLCVLLILTYFKLILQMQKTVATADGSQVNISFVLKLCSPKIFMNFRELRGRHSKHTFML